MIQCRKCISTPNTPVECIGQTERALRDRFGEHRKAKQNKLDDTVPQHLNINPDTNLKTSNLSYSNLSTLKAGIHT